MAHLQPHNAGELQHGDILMVIHDFSARSADELTLRRADRVELVELDEGFGDGWYLGRHLTTGATGLFPGVYTAKLPAHLSNVPRLVPTSQPGYDGSQSISDNVTDTTAVSAFVDNSSTHPNLSPYQHSPVPYVPEQQLPSNFAPNVYRQSTSHEALPSSSPAATQYVPGVQRSIGQSLDGPPGGQDSPVMNETLSVIDEHITDLSTPRQSSGPPEPVPEDSESDYNSSHLGRVPSAGVLSIDDEEKPKLTPEEVRQWDQKQVASHLRILGLEKAHCDIFEQQEITGDVLLDMDQAFIYMREYDFGVMGRRLKTWHKIRDFQNEVKGVDKRKRQSIHRHASEETGRTRGLSGGMILPRIPSLMESQGLGVRQTSHGHPLPTTADMPPPLQTQYSSQSFTRPGMGTATPPTAWRNSMIVDSPSRPSAALVRELTHSRRNSSIDFNAVPTQTQDSPVAPTTTTASTGHRKQPSLDRNWSLSNATLASTQASTPPLRLNTIKSQVEPELQGQRLQVTQSPDIDGDRGYFSSNDLDSRRSQIGLRKRDIVGSAEHSRQVSTAEDNKIGGINKYHNRISSADSVRDPITSMASPAAKAYYSSKTRSGRFRSASERTAQSGARQTGLSPTVTNLEDENPSFLNIPRSASGTASPSAFGAGRISTKAMKLVGMRTASDSPTNDGKGVDASPMFANERTRDSPRISAENSRAPSVGSKSLEIDNTDTSSKGGDSLRPAISTKTQSRTKPKTKQQTSAYTMGLLKISPQEAKKTCDHYGWAKKKASGLMTTWKPRLFILRGRRLSYYYSEQDTEERGVIDISGHKVLVANNDPIVTIHATITGAASATSPASPSSTSAETSPVAARTPSSGSGGLFYFKLVPPKAGASRAVQFTKPTVHYFQVDTIAEGRKWMGEILKATIEHDFSTFETTNRQKTISLAKAKARNERPPMLRGVDDSVPTTHGDVSLNENGLNIQGLNFEGSEFEVGFDEKSVGMESATTDQVTLATGGSEKTENGGGGGLAT